MYIVYIITGLALLASFAVSRERTLTALRIAAKRALRVMVPFFSMLLLVSAVLFLVPDTLISSTLGGQNKLPGLMIAMCFGSITLMPGFIAFPLAGILLQKGVSYLVLAGFTTTLMMVGVLTFPIERAYFGTRVAIIRNLVSLVIAVLTALGIGAYFGEIF